MYSYAQLKRLTNAGSLYTLADTAPEGGVEQDHVNRIIEHVGRQLLEVNYDSIRSQRHPNFLPSTAHTIETIYRIFEVVVTHVFNLLPKPDGLLSRPNCIGIEAKAISVERSRKLQITLE